MSQARDTLRQEAVVSLGEMKVRSANLSGTSVLPWGKYGSIGGWPETFPNSSQEDQGGMKWAEGKQGCKTYERACRLPRIPRKNLNPQSKSELRVPRRVRAKPPYIGPGQEHLLPLFLIRFRKPCRSEERGGEEDMECLNRILLDILITSVRSSL